MSSSDIRDIPEIPDVHRQRDARIAFDWGPAGVDALGPTLADDGVAVVVDVLSFTTTLSVAADRGVVVLPHPWRDGATEYAESHDAEVAVGREEVGEGVGEDGISLSPAAMRRHGRPGRRVVLPSPNGATLSLRLAEHGVPVVGGCLRNAPAVADWIAANIAGRIVVIAGGERWPDDTLRPAVEDLWGAGAVISALARSTGATLSVEAQFAASAYDVLGDPEASLRGCASGLELIERGFGEDVEIAGELAASSAVPVLRGDEFTTVGP